MSDFFSKDKYWYCKSLGKVVKIISTTFNGYSTDSITVETPEPEILENDGHVYYTRHYEKVSLFFEDCTEDELAKAIYGE
jgi:hypothetical protein